MFTGIITALGTVSGITPKHGDYVFRIETGTLDMSDVRLGDSIAVNGVCLTVINHGDAWFEADVSMETIRRSCLQQYRVGRRVNLEKALQVSDRLGGHIVSGHVDGIGTVAAISQDSRSYCVSVELPPALRKYVAEKGSICVDGVSLTVNAVSDLDFSLNIVPHTWLHTAFKAYEPGTQVNLEVDVIARYLERLLTHQEQSAAPDLSLAFLAEHGFAKKK